jgi:hypothetical protein
MAALSLARKGCLYMLKPGFHALDKMIQVTSMTRENRRFHVVLMEEDLAGKAARIAKKTHPATVEVHMLFRCGAFFLDCCKRIQEDFDAAPHD